MAFENIKNCAKFTSLLNIASKEVKDFDEVVSSKKELDEVYAAQLRLKEIEARLLFGETIDFVKEALTLSENAEMDQEDLITQVCKLGLTEWLELLVDQNKMQLNDKGAVILDKSKKERETVLKLLPLVGDFGKFLKEFNKEFADWTERDQRRILDAILDQCFLNRTAISYAGILRVGKTFDQGEFLTALKGARARGSLSAFDEYIQNVKKAELHPSQEVEKSVFIGKAIVEMARLGYIEEAIERVEIFHLLNDEENDFIKVLADFGRIDLADKYIKEGGWDGGDYPRRIKAIIKEMVKQGLDWKSRLKEEKGSLRIRGVSDEALDKEIAVMAQEIFLEYDAIAEAEEVSNTKPCFETIINIISWKSAQRQPIGENFDQLLQLYLKEGKPEGALYVARAFALNLNFFMAKEYLEQFFDRTTPKSEDLVSFCFQIAELFIARNDKENLAKFLQTMIDGRWDLNSRQGESFVDKAFGVFANDQEVFDLCRKLKENKSFVRNYSWKDLLINTAMHWVKVGEPELADNLIKATGNPKPEAYLKMAAIVREKYFRQYEEKLPIYDYLAWPSFNHMYRIDIDYQFI